MSNLLPLLAFLCISTCALGLSYNPAAHWHTKPVHIFSSSDANFSRTSDLSLGFTHDEVILLGQVKDSDSTTYMRRLDAEDFTPVAFDTVVDTFQNVWPNDVAYGENVRFAAKVDGSKLVIMKNMLNETHDRKFEFVIEGSSTNSFYVNQVLAHRDEYHVVLSNYTLVYIASFNKDFTTNKLSILTTRRYPISPPMCVGIQGKDSLYCLFGYSDPKNDNKLCLVETIFNLSTRAIPEVSDFFDVKIEHYNINAFSIFSNADTYGAIYYLQGIPYVKNAATGSIVTFDSTLVKGERMLAYAHDDETAVFFMTPATPEGRGETAKYYNVTVQYIDTNGATIRTADLYSNVTNAKFVNFKNDLFVLAYNDTDAYLGQLWQSSSYWSHVTSSLLIF